jgi:hypothetical protein
MIPALLAVSSSCHVVMISSIYTLKRPGASGHPRLTAKCTVTGQLLFLSPDST